MSPRQQPRRISRELALLSLSQIKGSEEKLEQVSLNELVLAAIRTLSTDLHETLENAASEVTKSNELLLGSETKASSFNKARNMVKDAIELTQTAINRLAGMVEIPEMLQLASQYEVREYALEIISTVHRRRREIEQQIQDVMTDWQLNRLAKIDRDTLLIAVAEMVYLEVPPKVAANEAVELAKRYSDEDGYRFINGVIRRVIDRMKTKNKEV